MWEMDYDAAADFWNGKEKKPMEPEKLKEHIDEYISKHNTCALATANGDMVRCTPMEYIYVDGCFYFFSEGGQKFRCLKDNKSAGIAIYEPYESFSNVSGLQVNGKAEVIEPFNEEYNKLLEHKRISVKTMKELPKPMNLIKVTPDSFDLFDSSLKDKGCGSRQHYESK